MRRVHATTGHLPTPSAVTTAACLAFSMAYQWHTHAHIHTSALATALVFCSAPERTLARTTTCAVYAGQPRHSAKVRSMHTSIPHTTAHASPRTMPRWSFSMATSIAVSPSASFANGVAFASSRSCATAMLPFLEAQCSGVPPDVLAVNGEAATAYTTTQAVFKRRA